MAFAICGAICPFVAPLHYKGGKIVVAHVRSMRYIAIVRTTILGSVMRVPIDLIKVGERKRRVDDVSELAKSIALLGLLQPIVITQDYRLVAGERRLKACKQLGWTEIEATVATLDDLSAELAEIDENIVRQELTVLERAEQLARRKEIYEALHPEAKPVTVRGGPGRGNKTSDTMSSVLSFSEDTATKTGLSPRSVQRDVQIATRIAPDVRDALRDTPIADSKRDLLALASVDEDTQREALQMIERGEERDIKRAVLALKVRNQSSVDAAGSAVVYEMDAIEFLRTQLDASADLLLSDPPYSTDIADIERFAHEWVPLALSKIKPTGRAYIFTGAYPQELKAYLDMLLSLDDWTLDNVLVWTYENTMGPSPKYGYKLNWQACFYLYGPDAPPIQCPTLIEQFTVHDVPAPGIGGVRWHAHEKPMQLAERFIRHSTQPGDTVLDPYAGTGTFLLAAKLLGRRGVGSEIDPDMLRIANNRGITIARSQRAAS